MRQFRLLLGPVAVILIVMSFFMAACGILAFFYGEYESFKSFILICLSVILISIFVFKFSGGRSRGNISMRSGFLLVCLIWLAVTAVGALPYYVSGWIPKFADALFESVSGFTTTGATIMTDIDSMPKSILLWRALTHWLGGGGIIVLSVAILPLLGIGGMQIMNAEASGVKREKVTPRIAQTAKYVWLFYICATTVIVGLLVYGGMDVFDSICHAFSAISTGGFANKNASIGYYNSAYIDWVLTFSMLLGAVNFMLLIKFMRGNFSVVLKNSEFKAFLLIFVVGTIIVAFSLHYSKIYASWADAFRYAAFQVSSIFTTTGMATADYELWPLMAQAVIFMLFFVGGCSGSTSGGVKVVRYVILIRQAMVDLKSLIHPNAVYHVRINSEPLDNRIIKSVSGFFVLYILLALTVSFIVASSGVDIWTSFTVSLSTLGTIGPGFGKIGPSQNYSMLPDYIKYVLSFNMLLGRLELYTFLVILTPWFWKR